MHIVCQYCIASCDFLLYYFVNTLVWRNGQVFGSINQSINQSLNLEVKLFHAGFKYKNRIYKAGFHACITEEVYVQLKELATNQGITYIQDIYA